MFLGPPPDINDVGPPPRPPNFDIQLQCNIKDIGSHGVPLSSKAEGHLLTSTNNPTAALLSHVTTRLSSAPALRPAVTNSTNNTLYARSAGAAYDEWVNVTTAAGQLNTSTSQSHVVTYVSAIIVGSLVILLATMCVIRYWQKKFGSHKVGPLDVNDMKYQYPDHEESVKTVNGTCLPVSMRERAAMIYDKEQTALPVGNVLET